MNKYSVAILAGENPIVPDDQRKAVLAALECAGAVVRHSYQRGLGIITKVYSATGKPLLYRIDKGEGYIAQFQWETMPPAWERAKHKAI